MNGKRLLHRLIWIEVACFALLVVFITVDDEYLIPRFIQKDFPWSPTTVAAVIDSLWVVVLMALALYIQIHYLKKIRLLEGMLSVCAHCKRIRDEKQQWRPIEEYIQERSHADFSHGICPDCGVKMYGDLYLKSTLQSGQPDPG